MSDVSSPTGMYFDALNTHVLDALNDAHIAVEWVNCKTGRFIRVNEYAAAMHDLTVDDIVGRELWELDPLFDAPKFYAVMEELRVVKTMPLETEHIKASGEHFPIEVSMSYRGSEGNTPEHFVAFIRDISERKAREQELVSVRKELQHALSMQESILNNLGEALVISDHQGKIVRFSTAAEELFGYREHEVIGKNLTVLMPQDIAVHHASYMSNFDKQSQMTILGKNRELIACRKDGSQFYTSIIVTHIVENNQPLFVALLRDITKQRENQQNLIDALEAADSANKAKGDFLANMSHEIRTPLNGVLGSLQLLQQRDLSGTSANLINTAMRSSMNLLGLINDILDYSKIEAGKMSLEHVCFSFSDVLKHVLHECYDKAKSKGLKLIIGHDKEVNDYWMGDPLRIHQILLNLISNAVKFTEQGSITVSVHHSPENQPKQLCFSIEDTGIGMSQAALQRLFTRFEQADNSITRRFGGTGLGLAISSNLIELMSGSISVTSEEEKGSKFTVRIPLPPASKPSTDEMPVQSTDIPNLSNITVLLAEDNVINQEVFKAMLAPTMANIIVVDNGQEAVDSVPHTKPDIVFMDIQMPVMDGVTACQTILASEPTLPIVALTANVLPEDIQQYLANGFCGHIGKPILLDELFNAFSHVQTD